MNYYLGVDIGTTSVKAVAFSRSGEPITQHACTYGMQHPQPSWSEQNPDEIVNAVTTAINTVLTALSPAQPVFLSFSAAMHSLIAVDTAGKPLTNCIIWADNRAAGIAQSLRGSDMATHLYQTTGVPVHAMSPFCKLLWLKANEAAVFNSAYKFIGLKEYLFFTWFGIWAADASIASATGMLNLKTLQWHQPILDIIGIGPEKLSVVVPVKQVFNYEPGKQPGAPLQLTAATPFVIGSSDGALANLATGPAHRKALVVTIGTSGAARILIDHIETDSYMRSFCYHAIDNYYIAGGAGNNGAVVLQWLKETLLQTSDSFEQLFALATTVPAGCNGLLCLPYILGERAPIWDPQAKGVFFGLTISHTKAHLVRAVLESVIFSMYSIGRIIIENNDPPEIYASGGFAQSPLWLQILADTFNKKVVVADTVESSALGAVFAGMEALNIEPERNDHLQTIYTPNPVHHDMYQQQFRKFERLYELLKDEFA